MVAGVDRLRKAREVLVARDCERAAVLEAAGEFWSATFDSEAWPVELKVKSLPARYGLVRHGSFEETIGRLDDAELRQLCRELCEVADLADRLHGGS